MHLVTCLVLLLVHCHASDAVPADSPSLNSVQGTGDIAPSIDPIFTISPDDQWIVYFGKRTPEIMGTEFNHTYGLLRVLNLRSGNLDQFKIPEEEFAYYPLRDMTPTWAPDSTLCVLPPPPEEDRRLIIQLTTRTPELLFVRLPDPFKPPRPREPTPGELVKLPDTFTCSDCPPRADDSELLRKHIPKELLFVGNFKSLTEYSRQSASFDGTKVYYQEGPQGKAGTTTPWAEVTLYEVDAATGTKRVLARHNADCPMIDQLRPSPDGTKLAYQLTTGCGFIGTPDVIVLDLTTGKAEDIALGSGAMRWSSTSDKLYFNRDFLNEPDDGHLWVAEFSKEKLTPAAPSVPATTQPAK